MPTLLLSPRTVALFVIAIVLVGALLLAIPGLGLGGPVIHWPPNCPPACWVPHEGSPIEGSPSFSG